MIRVIVLLVLALYPGASIAATSPEKLIKALEHLHPAGDEQRILLPLHIATEGALGSRFTTDFAVFNRGAEELTIRGLSTECAFLCVGPDTMRVTVPPGRTAREFRKSGRPGQFIILSSGADVDYHLRARDYSRSSLSMGAQLPLVPASEFAVDGVNLVNVRTEAAFRSTLRIYGNESTTASIRVVRETDNSILEERSIVLTEPEDEFDPAYAELHKFPSVTSSNVRIEVRSHDSTPIWAFVSVTNNVTQEITLIVPTRP